ncbi:MAG: hypothetical protein KGI11_09695 [Thaumarchaeota archaeon]|nr:hypothetical protein [Nitrososphaerota archaeon]
MQKGKNPSPDLTQEELEAIERLESGKGKYRNFENAQDAIDWLHGKDTKRK